MAKEDSPMVANTQPFIEYGVYRMVRTMCTNNNLDILDVLVQPLFACFLEQGFVDMLKVENYPDNVLREALALAASKVMQKGKFLITLEDIKQAVALNKEYNTLDQR